MKNLILIATLAVLAGCTQNDKATKLLQDHGYTNIRMTGYSFFSCSKDDTFQTGFTATTPAGKTVDGTVCAGLFFKGATIRFE